MLLLRRVTFALFTGAYLVVCPLTILYALGYVVHPLAGEGLLKTGLISVESRPEGAILYLEGKRYAHRTPAIIPGLRPGRYALRVAARGHRPWHGVVTVEAEQATALDHLLLLPRRLPAQRLLRGPFQQLRGIPDTRFLLLAHGRRLADLLVYDSASGEARPASDYDIGLYQGSEIPWKVMSRIQNELEEFPIPVDIELVDFSAVSDDFKKLALKNIRLWNKPEKNLTLI